MAYCQECGNELEPDSKFCASCGATVPGRERGGQAAEGTEAPTQVTAAGAGATPGTGEAPKSKGPFSNPAVIIGANVAAIIVIAAIAIGAWFIFRDDGGGSAASSAGGSSKTGTASSRTATSTTRTTATTPTTPTTRTSATNQQAAPQGQGRAQTPAPAQNPAPAAGSAEAEKAAILDVVMSDPLYGGGDSYDVASYNPDDMSAIVLITYYGDQTWYTELYMYKDQYGWYVDSENTY
jgi:hypothetical protein